MASSSLCAVFMCNGMYYDKFKKSCEQLITIGNYKGPIVLAVFDDLHVENDTFIKDNKIIIKRFDYSTIGFSNEFIVQQYNLKRPPHWFNKRFQLLKLFLFDEYFKTWDYIFYIDCGMIIMSDITPILNEKKKNILLANRDGVDNETSDEMETPGEGLKIGDQFVKFEPFYSKLKNNFNMKEKCFQTTFMLYDTNIIENDTKDKLFKLLFEYPISKTNDQGIISLYFTQIKPSWEQIRRKNKDIYFYDYVRCVDEKYIMIKFDGNAYLNIGYNSKKIAIYNGFSFHYEMFGYIIHYCKTNNYNLTIYSDDNLGYKDYYKTLYSINEYRPVSLFHSERQNYDFIFLMTDDDWSYKTDTKKTICIDHYYKIRNHVFENRIATRPFSNEYYRKWALPIYPIKNSVDKNDASETNMSEININEINIVLLSDDSTYNMNVLKRLKSNNKIILHAISRTMTIERFKDMNDIEIQIYRNIDTTQLIHILSNASYVITDISESKRYATDIISGSIPLAFSTLTPLIISKETNSYYKFKNVIEFDKNSMDPIVLNTINIDELKKERDELIQNNHNLFDSMIE